jgi:hypothetical protein
MKRAKSSKKKRQEDDQDIVIRAGERDPAKLADMYKHLVLRAVSLKDISTLRGLLSTTEAIPFLTEVFHQAVADSDNEISIVEVLLKHKSELANVPMNGLWPLHIAINHGFSQIVALLLKYHANYEQPLSEGKDKGATPLLLAVLEHKIEIVKLLLKQGANPNYVTLEGPHIGLTPLMMALNMADYNAIKLLRKKAPVTKLLESFDEQQLLQIQKLDLSAISTESWQISLNSTQLTLLIKDPKIKKFLKRTARNNIEFTWDGLMLILSDWQSIDPNELQNVLKQAQDHVNRHLVIARSDVNLAEAPVKGYPSAASVSQEQAHENVQTKGNQEIDKEQIENDKKIKEIHKLNKHNFEFYIKPKMIAAEKRQKEKQKEQAKNNPTNERKGKTKVVTKVIPPQTMPSSPLSAESSFRSKSIVTQGEGSSSRSKQAVATRGIEFFTKPDYREGGILLPPKPKDLPTVVKDQDTRNKNVASLSSGSETYGVKRIITYSLKAISNCLTEKKYFALGFVDALHYHLLRLAEALAIYADTNIATKPFTANDKDGRKLANILIHLFHKVTNEDVMNLANLFVTHVSHEKDFLIDIDQNDVYKKFKEELFIKQTPDNAILLFQKTVERLPQLQDIIGKFNDLTHFSMDPLGVKAATFIIMITGECYKQLQDNNAAPLDWPPLIIMLLKKCQKIRNKERHKFDAEYHPSDLDYLVEPVMPVDIFKVACELIEHSDTLKNLADKFNVENLHQDLAAWHPYQKDFGKR